MKMSEKEELDPKEEIKITRELFQAELQKAHTRGFEVGSSEKYKTLGAFLFSVVEKYSEILTPKASENKKFLKFVIHSLEEQYLEKYEKELPPEKEDPKEDSKEEG